MECGGCVCERRVAVSACDDVRSEKIPRECSREASSDFGVLCVDAYGIRWGMCVVWVGRSAPMAPTPVQPRACLCVRSMHIRIRDVWMTFFVIAFDQHDATRALSAESGFAAL